MCCAACGESTTLARGTAAAITAGDDLESGGATGTVQTRTTGTIIGRAMDSAGAAGDIIRVEIIKPI